MKNFGILTLATTKDYKKAIGLALSLRVSNPSVQTAVACEEALKEKLRPYFNYVITEHKNVRGFAHKVYLDQYTPFDLTFFFDSDVLIFKDLLPIVEQWMSQPYVACGGYRTDGISSFGLDRKQIIKRFGFERLVCIDGAGHALFDKVKAKKIFDRARHITSEYANYVPGARYADEDVLSIVMTEAGLVPANGWNFFSRLLSAKKGTLLLDSRVGLCKYIEVSNNLECLPCMMHFAADEGYVRYTFELYRLFKKFDVPVESLFIDAIHDGIRRDVRPKIKKAIKKLGLLG